MTDYLNRCEFEYGGEGQFYQHVRHGSVVAYLTLTGEPMELPFPCGYRVVEPEINLISVGFNV